MSRKLVSHSLPRPWGATCYLRHQTARQTKHAGKAVLPCVWMKSPSALRWAPCCRLCRSRCACTLVVHDTLADHALCVFVHDLCVCKRETEAYNCREFRALKKKVCANSYRERRSHIPAVIEWRKKKRNIKKRRRQHRYAVAQDVCV